VPLANGVGGEQTFNVGKTDEIAQRIVAPPGSEITSAHDDTRFVSRPNPRLGLSF